MDRRAGPIDRGAAGVLLTLLFTALLTIACGGDDGGGTTDPGGTTPNELTESGWENFESGDNQAAADDFQAAANADPFHGEAQAGLGWVFLRADSLVRALGAFNAALSVGYQNADVYAGKAVLLPELTPPDYPGAADAAGMALSFEPRYSFEHDTAFNWRDLRLILARSWFALTHYDDANSEVDSLGGTPATPGADTFVSDLLAVVVRLSALE